ncbi:MAG: M48 family metallopeptidase [Methylomonas sp.]
MPIDAIYYDGQSSRRREVQLSLDGDTLRIHGKDFQRNDAITSVTIPRSLAGTPRQILFADGGRLDIADHQQFTVLLPAENRSLPAKLEASWLHAGLALLLTLGFVAGAYFWGLPYAAEQAAAKVPDYLLTKMDQQFFDNPLGQSLFHASTLSLQRQQIFVGKIQALRLPLNVKPDSIQFRRSPAIGANAFALPGGSLVILDELVNLAADDEEIIAVVMHELGHVNGRHALRQMFQASAVGLLVAWYIGDTSSLLAAAPTALLQTRYSRQFEQQADEFAALALTANGIPDGQRHPCRQTGRYPGKDRNPRWRSAGSGAKLRLDTRLSVHPSQYGAQNQTAA